MEVQENVPQEIEHVAHEKEGAVVGETNANLGTTTKSNDAEAAASVVPDLSRPSIEKLMIRLKATLGNSIKDKKLAKNMSKLGTFQNALSTNFGKHAKVCSYKRRFLFLTYQIYFLKEHLNIAVSGELEYEKENLAMTTKDEAICEKIVEMAAYSVQVCYLLIIACLTNLSVV